MNDGKVAILVLAGVWVWPARPPLRAALLGWCWVVRTITSSFFPDCSLARVLERGVLAWPFAGASVSGH